MRPGPAPRSFPPAPLLFEENLGQITDEHGSPRRDVLYTLRGGAVNLLLTRQGIEYVCTRIAERILGMESTGNVLQFSELTTCSLLRRLFKKGNDRVDTERPMNVRCTDIRYLRPGGIGYYPAASSTRMLYTDGDCGGGAKNSHIVHSETDRWSMLFMTWGVVGTWKPGASSGLREGVSDNRGNLSVNNNQSCT
jgi:hypothetical protein